MSSPSSGDPRSPNVQMLCIGSGRFLRGLLLPLLQQHRPSIRAILLQPRGHDVSDAITAASNSYESDTIDREGVLSSVTVRNVHAAFSASSASECEIEACLSQQGVLIELIAVGVTEAGLAEGSPAMTRLGRSLELLQRTQPQQRVSVVDLDNVSGNGDKIKRLMCSLFACSPACLAYLASHVTFHNSVVDRITAARPDNSLVPRGEPIPHKGLVIEDVGSVLPQWLLEVPHVVIRRGEGELLRDAQLKLRCANATHTAVVYTMALSGSTSIAAACASHPHLLLFLDRLYDADISSLPRALQLPEADVKAFYMEWRARVAAPSVDMSPFWVAQNAVAKIGERLVPTIVFNGSASPCMIFVLASILRYLTPTSAAGGNVFAGKLDQSLATDAPHEYVPALSAQGFGYTFSDGSGVALRLLGNFTAGRDELEAAVKDALQLVSGWSAVDPSIAQQVAAVYILLIGGARALDMCLELVRA